MYKSLNSTDRQQNALLRKSCAKHWIVLCICFSPLAVKLLRGAIDMAPMPYPCVATHIPCNLTPDASLSPVERSAAPRPAGVELRISLTAFNRHVFELLTTAPVQFKKGKLASPALSWAQKTSFKYNEITTIP